MQTLVLPEHKAGRQFKISIIIITVFIKEPYTLEKSCRKWSLTACTELERERDTFVRDREGDRDGLGRDRNGEGEL